MEFSNFLKSYSIKLKLLEKKSSNKAKTIN